VRVGVVEPLDRHLAHVRAEELAGEVLRPLRLQTVVGVDLRAVDLLEDEHLLPDERVNHLRHDEVVGVGEHRGDQLGIVRLLAEVELAAEVHFQLLRQRGELKEARGLGPALDERRLPSEQVEVDLHLLDDPRAPYLHDDLAAGLQERRTDLRDRRRRERLGVDPREVHEADFAVDHRLEL